MSSTDGQVHISTSNPETPQLLQRQPDGKIKDNGEDPIIIPKTTKFDDGECAICCTSPQVNKTVLPCQHIFCYECIQKWRNTKNACPVCRQKITYIVNTQKMMEKAKPLVMKELRRQCSDKECEREELLRNQRLDDHPEDWDSRIATVSSRIDKLYRAISGHGAITFGFEMLPEYYAVGNIRIYD